MATYSYGRNCYERFKAPPSLSSLCEHKSSSAFCQSPLPKCCSCSDFSLPPAGTASSYSGSERWSNYCGTCQAFWKRQPEDAKNTLEYPKPAATENPQQGRSNSFARLNAPFNTVPYIPQISSRIVPPSPAMVPSRPVIITSNPLIVPSPSPALHVLAPPQNSPLRKKKRGPSGGNNNKKPGQSAADVGRGSGQPEEGPSNSQNENTLGVEPPVVTVPAYVCPAARAGAQRVPRGTGATSAPAQAEEPTRRWSLTSLHSAPGSSEGSTSGPQRHVSFNTAGGNSRGHQSFYGPRATGTSYQAPRSSSGLYQPYKPPTQPLRSSGTYVPPSARNSAESRNLLSEWRPARPGDLGSPRLENNTMATRDSAQEARHRSRTWEGTPVPDPPDGSWSSDVAVDWQPPIWGTGQEAAGAPAGQSPVSENSLFPRNRPPSRDQLSQVQPQGPIVFGDSNSPVTDSGPSDAAQPASNATPGWLEWTGAFFNGSAYGLPTARDLPATEISWDAPPTQPLSSDPELRRYTIHNSQSGGASQGPMSIRRKHIQDAHNQTQVQHTNNTTPRQTPRARPPYRRSVGISAAPVILPISTPQAQRMVALPTILNSNFHESESDEDNALSNLAPPRRRQVSSNEPTVQPTLPDQPPRLQAVNPGPSVPPPIPPPMSPAVSDGWEKWDTNIWEAAARKSAPEQVDLAKIAEDASVLLELFSKTKPRSNVDIGNEHKEMIENAFQGITKIRKELRLIAVQKNESIGNLAPPEGGDGAAAVADSECIICYSHIADTVVLPCKHLVLCMTCCDKMGIKEKAQMINPNIQCPICRTKVQDRLKIFRG